MAPNPFISYARKDLDIALRIRRDLIAKGARPWLDIEDLVGGADWQLAIDSAIRSSSHFIAVLSTHSVNKRGFVQKELRNALEILDQLPPDAIFVIPVRLDDCEPKHDRLLRLHRIDLFPDYDAGFQRLAKSLGLKKRGNPPNRSNRKPTRTAARESSSNIAPSHSTNPTKRCDACSREYPATWKRCPDCGLPGWAP